jgi:hypothetical protein
LDVDRFHRGHGNSERPVAGRTIGSFA